MMPSVSLNGNDPIGFSGVENTMKTSTLPAIDLAAGDRVIVGVVAVVALAALAIGFVLFCCSRSPQTAGVSASAAPSSSSSARSSPRRSAISARAHPHTKRRSSATPSVTRSKTPPARRSTR